MIGFISKFKKALPIVLLPIVSYGILGPLEIVYNNPQDIPYRYSDFLGYFVVICLAAWLLLSAVIAALPEKAGNVISALVLGFGVASYLQNMFMNVKLSELDGSPMDWEPLRNYTFINWVIWVAIILAVLCIALYLKKYWNTVSMAVSGFLCVIQLGAVFFLLITAGPADEDSGMSFHASGAKQMSVAPKDNVIVFILDSTGNTSLESMLELYPDALDGLHDFTYFNNADCHYYFTYPSVSHMLTGEELDFEMSSINWLKTAWASERANNFWGELHNDGYTCNIYSSHMSYVYGDTKSLKGKFDNIIPIPATLRTELLVKLLAKMSAYKYVPYVLKPLFEVLTKEFYDVLVIDTDEEYVTDNGEFYQQLTGQKLSIESAMENAFIIQHIAGLHDPLILNENAQTVEKGLVSKEETMKGLTVILNEYLNQLRDLGVYDNATMIITADHGIWDDVDRQPIFLIKRPFETHEEVQINTAPISLDDFQATVFDVLGKDYLQYGTSIYDWSEGSLRERILYLKAEDRDWPKITGSSVYQGYIYFTDKEELNRKIEEGIPDVTVKIAQ